MILDPITANDTDAAIMEAARHMGRAFGNNYIPQSAAAGFTDTVLAIGRDLARLCGVPASKAATLRGHEILPFYTSALSAGGPSAARKRAGKYGSPPAIPAPSAAPSSAYTAPGSITADELASIKRAISEAAREDAVTTATRVANDVMSGTLAGFDQLVADTVAKHLPTRIEIVTPSSPAPIDMGIQHESFPDLLAMLAIKKNVYLHGPAGSGKTTAAEMAAKALNLNFYASAKLEDAAALLGYEFNGVVAITPFRRAYTEGGLFLFDELDDSDPSSIVAMNMALANKFCPFPDALLPMHTNFRLVAGGNTELDGASMLYSTRKKLDGASIDRLKFLHWGYDEQLERHLAPHKQWCAYVQAMRQVFKERGLDQDRLISPRATIDGGDMLNAGIRVSLVKSSNLWKGLDADTVKQLEHACPVKFEG